MNIDKSLYRSIAIITLITGLLLLIPLIAMQFSDEVVWTLSDFVIAGILLFGTGLSYKLITRRSGKTIYKIAIGFSLFSGLFLIWANLAVGIIGSENNAINLFYFGVIAVGLLGALIARFQSRGMAVTMFVMALAQGLVAALAVGRGMHHNPYSPLIEIVAINGLFITLFAISAVMFWYADINPQPETIESDK